MALSRATFKESECEKWQNNMRGSFRGENIERKFI
jgi:hypothetical protein